MSARATRHPQDESALQVCPFSVRRTADPDTCPGDRIAVHVADISVIRPGPGIAVGLATRPGSAGGGGSGLGPASAPCRAASRDPRPAPKGAKTAIVAAV